MVVPPKDHQPEKIQRQARGAHVEDVTALGGVGDEHALVARGQVQHPVDDPQQNFHADPQQKGAVQQSAWQGTNIIIIIIIILLLLQLTPAVIVSPSLT
jgi:hypothetical protein